MKSIAFLTAATALLMATPAAAHDHAAKGKKAATMKCAAIPAGAPDALFRKFNAAWASKNPDTVADLFSRDAVLLATVSNVPRTDRAGIRDYFVSFLKGSPVGTRNTSNVREGCNLLTDVGTWTVGLTNQNSGVRNNVKARYSLIYKYEDGIWKIAHLHSSMMPVSE